MNGAWFALTFLNFNVKGHYHFDTYDLLQVFDQVT